MHLKTIFVRFYKSFNYDYLKKYEGKTEAKPWEKIEGLWYPYVQIPTDPKVTTIVGANESGKSHLLSAIEKGTSGEGIKRQDFCRYSKFLTVKQGDLKLPDFGFEWSGLSEKDKTELRSLCNIPEDTLFENFFLFRNNQNNLNVYLNKAKNDYTHYEVNKNNVAAFKNFLPHVFRLDADIALPESVPLRQLIDVAFPERVHPKQPSKNGNKSEASRFEYLERKDRAKIIQSLDTIAEKPESYTNPQPGLNKPDPQTATAMSSLITVLTESDQSEESEKRNSQYKLAYDLICKIAKVDREVLENLVNSLRDGNEGYVNGILAKINSALAESLNFPHWWVQDREFCLLVSAREYDLVFTISDRTGTEYSFKERSRGLQYFLSYYIQYLAHEPYERNTEILLMDEPDSYLSSQAQQDLLKIFEAFSNPEENSHLIQPIQVIYVTHSPFLINKNHAERIRVLDKGKNEEGTRVVKDAARNHYEPLRSSLGAFVGETTFIGNCNLIVEGISDQILIAGAATYLRSRKVSDRETLDLNHFTIAHAGGASAIPYMVYLACGRDVEQPVVIVLLDSDSSGNEAKKKLTRGGPNKKHLKENFILQIGELASESELNKHGSITLIAIEDLIPLQICVEAAKTYAREFCQLSDSNISLISENKIIENLTNGETIFKAIEVCFQGIPEDINIEKAAFARTVIETVTRFSKQEDSQNNISSNGLKEFECNFKLFFRHLNKIGRNAERELSEKRISNKIDRLIKSFLRDHPEGAKREQADMLLDDIEAVLDDGIESDSARDEIKKLHREHNLKTELVEPIKDYDKFKEGIQKIKYAGKIATQE